MNARSDAELMLQGVALNLDNTAGALRGVREGLALVCDRLETDDPDGSAPVVALLMLLTDRLEAEAATVSAAQTTLCRLATAPRSRRPPRPAGAVVPIAVNGNGVHAEGRR